MIGAFDSSLHKLMALIGNEMIPVVLPERVRELPADLGIAKPQNFSLPIA